MARGDGRSGRDEERAATVREDGEKVEGEGEIGASERARGRERKAGGYREVWRVRVCETGAAIGMPRARGAGGA